MTLLICLFSISSVSAKTITADKLEYDGKTKVYYMYGNVVLKQDNTTLTADFGNYDENTSYAYFSGNVFYEDTDVKVQADEAAMFTDNKTGTLTRANMVFKKDGYFIKGETIIKRGENTYYAEKSSFTSCDTPIPAWCFQSDTVDIDTEDKIVAKGVSFKINDTSVLYTPVFQMGLKRKTGFLMPTYGYKKGMGTYVNVPFYYVISENRDMTIVVDTYTKRGVGEGLEYRYVEKDNVTGSWYIYHLKDRFLKEDFLQVRGEHKQFQENFYTNFNVHYLNNEDYYKYYTPSIQLNISRFLQSSGDIGYATDKTRAYMLSEYWVDLKYYTRNVSQKLPEIGFTVHPTEFLHSTPLKTSLFLMDSSVSNFISEQSVKGKRFDLYPKVLYSFGDKLRFTQSAGVRSTFYDVYLNRQPDSENNYNSTALTYSGSLDTTLVKNYGSVTHVLQPSLSYNYVSNGLDNLTTVNFTPASNWLDTRNKLTLDSTEYFKKTSIAELSLMNYLRDGRGTFLYAKLSEGYDTSLETNKLQPLKFQLGTLRPIEAKAEALYDLNSDKLKGINSEITFKFKSHNTILNFAERYNREMNIMYLTNVFGFNVTPKLRVKTTTWYDATLSRFGYFGLNLIYTQQCWSVGLLYSQTPGTPQTPTSAQTPSQYGFYLTVELKGVGKYDILGSGQSTM
ncbi:LPS-assembly protein LptD [Candidatus Magnetomonas plexicatena]|uniref:LPS-assembly protein LptD n=1 Tax=Candidatus Magnetomonas plexicatena TaxID=2552947 RepID=UPI004032E100